MLKQYILLVDRTDEPAYGKVILEEYDTSVAQTAAATAYAKNGVTCASYTRTSTTEPGPPTITPG